MSLAFATYQTEKLFLIGLQPDGRLSVFERTFNGCMGMWSDGQAMWMSSLYQLWRFENVLDRDQLAARWLRSILRAAGGIHLRCIDVHDVCVNGEGCVVFANILYLVVWPLSARRQVSSPCGNHPSFRNSPLSLWIGFPIRVNPWLDCLWSQEKSHG